MIRRKTHRKTRWVQTITLCCLGLVTGLVLVARLSMESVPETSIAPEEVLQEGLDDGDAVTEALSQPSRASLPAKPELPRNWQYRDTIRPLDDEAFLGTLSRVVLLGKTLLIGRNLAPSKEGETSQLAGILEEIAEARRKGTLAPIEERIDLSRHSREDVLTAIDEYLGSLVWLQEMEVGLARGLVCLEDGCVDTKQGSEVHWVIGDALECRAVLEARRGEIDMALDSYLSAKRIGRLVSAASRYGSWSPEWAIARISDFAWRTTPFTPAQRRRVLQALTPRATLAASTDAALHRSVARLRRRDLGEIDARYSGLFQFFSRVRALQDSKKRFDALDMRIRELDQFLVRPPYEALPALRDIVAGEAALSSDWRDLAEETAKRCLGTVGRSYADIAALAFALKDYRRGHGEYPRSSEDLAGAGLPKLPVDPSCGLPLLYESDGKTFSICLPDRPPVPPNTPDRLKFLYPHPYGRRVDMWEALE